MRHHLPQLLEEVLDEDELLEVSSLESKPVEPHSGAILFTDSRSSPSLLWLARQPRPYNSHSCPGLVNVRPINVRDGRLCREWEGNEPS